MTTEALIGRAELAGEYRPSPVIKPRALRRGDTVGIVAPASPPFEPGQLDIALSWLRRLGLKYKLGKHLLSSYSDLAGTDEQRLEDLHRMWADPDVQAVIPIRGGNGSVRLLPRLDFELIGNNPKIFLGFSDITGMHIAINQRTGLVTFHGPTLNTFYESSYTYHYFLKAVMSSRPIGTITDPVAKDVWGSVYPPPRMVIAPGRARGRLTGGCLTLVRQLMGTPFEIDTAGKILFLEDVNEEPHNIDRGLSQLMLAGKLQAASGIIVAECVNCRPGSSKRNTLTLNYSVEHLLKERLAGLGIPVVYGMRFGHGEEKFTLPLGVMASLEATDRAVVFKIEERAAH